MPVDTQHPDYSRKIARWDKNRDAYEGEDAVKARSRNYLPAPGGFDQDDYGRYIMRAKWYGATARTVQGLTGAIFQKEPDIEASPAVEKHLHNITLTGISAELLASTVVSDVQLIGRYGILLDYDNNPILRRPYWSGIPAECIVNWHETYMGGQPKLSLVVLKEPRFRMKDTYDIEIIYRYRVCFINADGQYEVSIYETGGTEQNREMVQVEGYVPTRRNRPLDFIPFQFFGAADLMPGTGKAPMDDMVDINYAYLRHSADYEQALFLTGMPKYVVTGHDLPPGERLPVGSLSAWVFPSIDAKAYLLEYQGSGLESHERAMTNDKVEMATLGARLLEEQPVTAETLGAVQIRHSGETGSLRTVANLVSEGLSKVLRWHHWWNGDTENIEDEQYFFTLNTDFSTTRLTPQEIQALMQLCQDGRISKQTLFWNLKQGELIPAENEFEDEEAMIDAQAPARLPFGEDLEQEDDEDELDEDAA